MRMFMSEVKRPYKCAFDFSRLEETTSPMTALSLSEIIQALVDRGWTHDRIAAEVGASQPTVSRWAKGARTNYEMVERVRDLYSKVAGLTNETRTLSFTDRASLRGHILMDGEIYWSEPDKVHDVVLGFQLRPGNLAFVAPNNVASARIRKGELLIVSPKVEPSTMVGQEGLITYDDEGEEVTVFGLLEAGREPGRYAISSSLVLLSRNAIVLAAFPFVAIVSGRAWNVP